MKITGAHFLGNHRSKDGEEKFVSVSPATNETIGDIDFAEATVEEIDTTVRLSAAAFQSYRETNKEDRSAFLEAIALNIEALGDQLIEECMAESALPEGRLLGERGRTANQLRLFASVVRDGGWIDARIDTAIPDRQPLPKPDTRSMSTPLGPVAVFGASNFPLAFSVAGGDTASALAAGCPVIFKAHPAHPRTCELVAQAITSAAHQCHMPDGVFSMIHGRSHRVGTELVSHPQVKAVAFTGSLRGGLALYRLATTRPEPIPVFAEMGSTNPLFILPGASKERQDEIAKGLVSSVTLGAGQFCTNPGLIFAAQGADTDALIEKMSAAMTQQPAATMLTEGIAKSYEQGSETLKSLRGVSEQASGTVAATANAAQPHLFVTDSSSFNEQEPVKEELFGPSTVFVTAQDRAQLMKTARNLEGQLTATIHGTAADLEDYRELVAILEQKVGRLIFNGYPTGVEVSHAMVHGGPFPATTASGTTSVGTGAIKRFVRPVCYQDFPERLLPQPLQDANPWSIYRLVNGEMSRAPIK